MGDHWMAPSSSSPVGRGPDARAVPAQRDRDVRARAGHDGWRMRRPRRSDRRSSARSLVIARHRRRALAPALRRPAHPRSRATSRMLVRHFASEPPEPAIGARRRRAGVLPPPRRAVGDRRPVPPRRRLRPSLRSRRAATAARRWWCSSLWLVAAVVAHRGRHVPLIDAQHRDRGGPRCRCLLRSVRIFGKVWYYLTLWAWGTTLLMVLSIVWTGVVVAAPARRGRRTPVDRRWPVVVLGSGRSWSARRCRSAPRSCSTCPSHSCPTACVRSIAGTPRRRSTTAVGPAVGPDGRYRRLLAGRAVHRRRRATGSSTSSNGAGFDVGVHETWRVPVTPHRVFDAGTYDAEIHLVSGKLHRRVARARRLRRGRSSTTCEPTPSASRFDEFRDAT